MAKKNSRQNDPLPPYISCKRAILKTITNGLKDRIKHEKIADKMPKYKWQNDAEAIAQWEEMFKSYDRILNEFIKTGIYEGISTPSHAGIIKKQQAYYATILLKIGEFLDKIIKKYSIAKDEYDFLIKIEYDYADFLSKSCAWQGVRGLVSIIGKIGGKQRGLYQPILLAAIKYLEDNSKLINKNNNHIAESFKRKHDNEDKCIEILSNNSEWDVFCNDKYIFAKPLEDKINEEISVTIETFRKNYIQKAKDELNKKS